MTSEKRSGRSDCEPGSGTWKREIAATASREKSWLYLVRTGTSTKAIARKEGMTQRTVQRGLARARQEEAKQARWRLLSRDKGNKMHPENATDTSCQEAHGWGRMGRKVQEPELVPLFPIGAFTPTSKCPHHGPIRQGSTLCCMVCSASGMDDHPALKRDPRTDPRPDVRPEPAAAAGLYRGTETRKERRKRQFASRSPDMNQSSHQA